MSTRKPRLFTANAAMLPTEWTKAAQFETHHGQGNVAIVAPTKAAAIDMLTAAGAALASAESVVGQVRVRTGRPATHEQSLIDAGVLRLDQPSAVIYRNGVKGDAVVRVDDPALPIVARFAYASGRGGRGLYVEVAR